MDGLKLNKIISNGIEYEVQDSTLYNSLRDKKGILKSSEGGLFEEAIAGTDYDFPVITGQGAPSVLTIALGEGQRYIDLTADVENGRAPEYVCTKIDKANNKYTWVPAGITANQLPSVQGYIVSSTPPDSQYVLWVDSSDDGVLKYFNSETNLWEAVNTVWG